MGCNRIDLPGGGFAVACSRGQRRQRCQDPGCGEAAVALCDWPLATGKTCDRKMCARHRHPIRPEVDYCGCHFRRHKGEPAKEGR